MDIKEDANKYKEEPGAWVDVLSRITQKEPL